MSAFRHLSSQDASATSATSAVSATFPATASSGHLLLASFWGEGSSIGSATVGGGWDTGLLSVATPHTTAIFYKIANGTETSLTATAQGGATSTVLNIHEFALPISIEFLIDDASENASAGAVTELQFGRVNPARRSRAWLAFAALATHDAGTSGHDLGEFTKMSETGHLTDGFLEPSRPNPVDVVGTWSGASNADALLIAFSFELLAQTVTFKNEG